MVYLLKRIHIRDGLMDVDPESMIMHGYGLFTEKDPYQGWMHGYGCRIEDNAWIWIVNR